MNQRLVFTLRLTVRSPFLFRGLDGGMVGVDAAQLRNELGRPIIPADQVRGVLREALGDLAEASPVVSVADIGALFGGESRNEGESGTSNDPSRGTISFSDLAPERDLPCPKETTRIEVDDATGAVKRGHLQILELVAPFGEKVTFIGNIVVYAPVGQARRLEDLLGKALRLVSGIGAFKSAGFGEIVHTHSGISLKSERSLSLPAEAGAGPGRLNLRVSFDRPILVDAERIADNAFLGSWIIPGAVFKGALAERLAQAGLNPGEASLGEALSQLYISHAFPESVVAGKAWGLPLPLSLVAAKVGATGELAYGDVLDVPSGWGGMLQGHPAQFAGDWKDAWFGGAYSLLGCPDGEEPPALARTRTSISAETGTAKDGALFTAIARSVVRPDGSPRTWLVEVDFGKVADKALARQFASILRNEGLDRIGKTEAHAVFTDAAEASFAEPRPILGTANRFAIVLTTPALMLDAAVLCDDMGRWISSPETAYGEYWQSVLPGATLHSFFAAQRFTGGYLARRRRPYGPDRYFPFLLTDAGSVFDLEVKDMGVLAELLRYGLRPPLINGKAVTWRTCPYMPENGYGRVSADYLSRTDLRKGVTHG